MIQLLTLAGAGLAIFDGWASKNTKQMELFNKELEKNTETVDNAERVLKRYRDSFITTEQLQAVGTALGELTDGVTALSKSFQDTVANQGVWDGIKQGILSILGEGAQQDFAGAVASNWIKQIDMLPEGEVKSAVISKLQQVLNITDISVKGIKKAIADADVAKDVVARGEAALAPAVTRTRELGVQANSTRESITNLNKASLDLQNTFVDQSPIAKFAEALIKASLDIQKSFTTMEGSIAAFKEILSKPGAFSLIDINKLGQYQEAVKAQQEIIRLENERAAKQKSVEGLQGQLGEALRASGGRLTTPEQAATGLGTRSSRLAGRLQAQILSGQAEIEATTNKIDELTATGIKGLFNTVKETFGESVKKGFELLTTTANLALRQGELQISKAVIGGVSGPGVAQAQASLARQELAIQEQQVNIQGQLVDQLTLNTIAQQQANNLLQEAKIREKGGNLTQADEAILEQLSTSNQELAGLVQSIKTGAPISAGEIQKMGPQAGAIALQMALTRGGLEAQRAGFSSRRQIIAIDEEVNKLKEQQQIDLDIQNNLLKTLQYREKFVELSKSVLTNLSEQQIVESQILETNRVKKSQYIETLGLNSQIADLELRIKLEKDRGTAADAEILKGLATRLGYAKSILNITQNQQQKDLEILSIQQAQARIRAGLAKEAEDRQFNLFVQDKIQTVVEAELDAQSQLLEYQNSIGNLTADEYRLRKRNLDLRILEFDTVNKLRQIEGRRSEELAKIGGERTLAQAATGGVLSDADADRLYEREQRVNEQYNIEAQTLTRVNNLKKEGIYLTSSLNERQIAYGNMFKNTFDGLADALVKWAETGKWAGKDLFKSLTADLLRFELRAQTSQLYTSLIKPGLMTLLGRGPDLAMAGSYASAEGFAITNAKGGAYSFGIEKFAKGGMFTNSVINQPTLFKFARGTGLMGEAGPEAIMPLRRDGNGNLGVIGQQGKTQVVINNYSGERAETKETVDSRGNRKVEVVIGEAAALDLSTAGSSSQKSLRSTFGLAPQLIRR
jgi:phage-related minor tail protein